MFKKAYASRRCLVPIDGYFEWRKLDPSDKKKQPYAIAMRSGEPFALAGIWEEYGDRATGELVRTSCIVACEPNSLMATIQTASRSSWRRPTICAGSALNRILATC
ncbi:SOS response-associated peptidase [Mesorhizobium sp. M0622]|uniref:SOS response-associated peptidase family protein n=1 Tax=unclassified Mesorhizobium TaxID=325217 RepID=UPI0033381CC5